MFLRDLFTRDLSWDTPIDDILIAEWNSMCQPVDGTVISIPRCIGPSVPGTSSELWVFVDASKLIYACCAYISHPQINETSMLVSGKAKLTPMKGNVTIPRLELIALLLGTRMAHSIVNALKKNINNIHIVGDSKVALCWLKLTRNLPVFVRNQISRIKRICTELQSLNITILFHYIPSHLNPADIGTRGCTGEEISSTLWLNGPKWCSRSPDSWPIENIEAIAELHAENLEKDDFDTELVTHTQIACDVEAPANSCIPVHKFSCFFRLVRVTATVLLFIMQCAKHLQGRKISFNLSTTITDVTKISADLMNAAEKIIIRGESMHITLLEMKERFKNREVFRDPEGLLRYRSRLQLADLAYDSRNPVFIPNISPVSRLVIISNHIKHGHCGKQHLIAVVAQKYWIPRIGRLASNVMKTCITCKRFNGLPFKYPAAGPLPQDRVVRATPFQNTGMDFLGPFESKENPKCYICLFTCLTTRAVHLECVENLSAEAFIRAFQRFIARRGVPSIIRSDQGTNFRLAERVMNNIEEARLTRDSTVETFMANERIRWIFNPPNSPWMGGVWERLVQSVKRAYTKMVGRKKLSFVEMHTITTMIEAILNTRPITHADPSDISSQPIRPIDFLSQQIRYSIPSPTEKDEDAEFENQPISTLAQARQTIRNIDNMLDKFWESWSTTYLYQLRENHGIRMRRNRHGKRMLPEVGEIVLIEQELIPRGNWIYRLIVELIKSVDGEIRSAKIKAPNGRILHRPINKLYPMEIRAARSVSILPSDLGDRNLEEECDETCNPTACCTLLTESKNGTEKLKATKYPSVVGLHSVGHFIYVLFLVCIVQQCTSETVNLINCIEGGFHVHDIQGTAELCVQNQCETIKDITSNIRFLLPHYPNQRQIPIRLRKFAGNE